MEKNDASATAAGNSSPSLPLSRSFPLFYAPRLRRRRRQHICKEMAAFLPSFLPPFFSSSSTSVRMAPLSPPLIHTRARARARAPIMWPRGGTGGRPSIRVARAKCAWCVIWIAHPRKYRGNEDTQPVLAHPVAQNVALRRTRRMYGRTVKIE